MLAVGLSRSLDHVENTRLEVIARHDDYSCDIGLGIVFEHAVSLNLGKRIRRVGLNVFDARCDDSVGIGINREDSRFDDRLHGFFSFIID